MTNFTKSVLMLAIAATVGSQAQAEPLSQARTQTQQIYQAQNSSNVFNSQRARAIEHANSLMFKNDADAASLRGKTATVDQTFSPEFTIGPAQQIGDLDAPGGKLWFYNMNIDIEEVVMNPYWTQKLMVGFHVTIYDENHNKVGEIKDKLRLEGNETRACLCEVTPIVTKHFFNTDDKIEIAIGQGFNTPQYINNYRTKVYQLGGQKDSEGYDKPVYILNDLVTDVLDATHVGGEENFYITCLSEGHDDSVTTEPEEGTEDYWKAMTSYYYDVVVYSKATDETGPHATTLERVGEQNRPGDQGDTSPAIVTKMHNGKPIYVIPSYKETLSQPIYSYSDEPTQRPENKLIINVYTMDGAKASKISSTEIDAPAIEGNLRTYYGVGDLLYRGDVSFDQWGADENHPSFIITRNILATMAEEAGEKGHYVYNNAGEKVATIFEGCEAAISLTDIPGHEPQIMFIDTPDGIYTFHFVDLYSGKEQCQFSYQMEVEGSDPDLMTSNMDRVAVGDTYMYVNELRLPVEDNGDTFVRFAWLDNKGKWVRTDEVNMGADVKYAKSFVNGTMLSDPNTFYIDDEGIQEYMVLIKRGLAEGGDREELLIAQPRSESYPDGLTIKLFDESDKGTLRNIAPYSFMGVPQLMVGYYNQETDSHICDYYRLPFNYDDAGVNSVVTDPDNGISFDGTTVSAAGTVSVYNAAGILIARANGSLATGSLAKGLYIVRAGNAARKIVVK